MGLTFCSSSPTASSPQFRVLASGRRIVRLLGQAVVMWDNRQTVIIALMARHRLPAVYAYSYFVRDGGLVSYGTDIVDLYRQAASTWTASY